jgi:glucokinase
MRDQRALAIDFGGTNIRFAHVGADLQDLKIVRSRADLDREKLRLYFLHELEVYLRETKLQGHVTSINIAIAGQIDSGNGVVLASPNLPSWTNAPLKEWVESAVNVPTYLDNDVRAAALGELRTPGLEEVRNMVCLYWGTGIGGGILVDGRLLRGARNAAAEVGHLVYQPRGRRCNCGKRGCFEAYAGGWAIAEIVQEAVALQPDKELGAEPSTADVFLAAKQGHPLATRIRTEAIHAFSLLAANLVVAFNPEVLLIGGGLAGHYPDVLHVVEQAVEEYALAADKLGLRIRLSELGDAAALWGAAKLGAGV